MSPVCWLISFYNESKDFKMKAFWRIQFLLITKRLTFFYCQYVFKFCRSVYFIGKIPNTYNQILVFHCITSLYVVVWTMITTCLSADRLFPPLCFFFCLFFFFIWSRKVYSISLCMLFRFLVGVWQQYLTECDHGAQI